MDINADQTVEEMPEMKDFPVEEWITINQPQTEMIVPLPRRPKEYITVRAQGELTMAQNVTKHLNEGWDLYGDPFSAASGIYQAMVKYGEETDVR